MKYEELRALTSEERRAYYFKKNYKYDAELYFKYSSTANSRFTKEAHKSELIFYYHKIEKGLSLKEIKPFFGVDAVKYLIESLNEYMGKYGLDTVSKIAYANINEYFKYHEKFSDNEELMTLRRKFKFELVDIDVSDVSEDEFGTKIIEKADIAIENNFIDLCNNRHSIRQFTDENIEMDLIFRALEMAQTTPTVCNRQANRVFVIEDRNIMEEALSYQNGNAGFDSSINKLLVITSELNDFVTSNERNQPFIDGGMYAMTLIYALHSLGLGTCPLNLALDSDIDYELKQKIRVPENHVLIMMIAVGQIPEELPVAASKRLDIKEILKIVD